MSSDAAQSGRFCILVCGHMTKHVEDRFGDFGQMFERMLRSTPNEQWEVFSPVDDHWPTAEQMASYQVLRQTLAPLLHLQRPKAKVRARSQPYEESLSSAFMKAIIGMLNALGSPGSPSWTTYEDTAGIAVTGSALDAFDSVPWIVRLREELAAASQRRQRLLGICFGCQALAIALGGNAARAKIDYEIGTRHIHWSEAACSQLDTPWAEACPKGGQQVIHESHQDCVTKLPEGGVLLASSQDTRVEVWAYKEHVLCIQGHPEFSREFMEALVQWKAQATPDTFPPELAEAAIMELKQDAVSSSDEESWHQLCKAFLKYQVPA